MSGEEGFPLHNLEKGSGPRITNPRLTTSTTHGYYKSDENTNQDYEDLSYVTREKSQDNEGYDYLANSISEQHIYADLMKVAPSDRESPPPDYQESQAASVKASKSPNRGLIWKILLLIFGGSLAVIIFYFIINAIINGGGGGPLTTTISPPYTSPTELPSTLSSSEPPGGSSSTSSPGQSTTDVTSKTTTASTKTTTVPTTPGTDPPDAWPSWSSWSDCSVSCGDGEQTRTRDCPSGVTCEGSDTQSKPCNNGRCPGPDYGSWTSWGAWSQCTATCGTGSQERTRTCELEPEQEQCPGSSSRIRDCNDFDCPSCSDTCPDGGVMEPTECNRCICSGETFSARVTDSNNLAIEAVRIADDRWPNVILATTSETGAFSVSDACNGVLLRFSRAEYIETTKTISANLEVIIMDKIEFLSISEHPQNKVRVGGESVTLCCSASGSPPPEYFEWFKDGAIIDSSPFAYENQLVIASVTSDHSGFYRCRANNEYSAIYSEEAQLLIKDTAEDFCSPDPSPKIVSLPRGCTYDGHREVDVMQCHPSICRFENHTDSGECRENVGLYCCGSMGFDTVMADCSDGFQIPVAFVTSCGCIQCPFLIVKVVGVVMDAETKQRWPVTEVIINGTVVSVGNIDGEFNIELNILENPVVAITVRDPYQMHLDATKVIHLKKSKKGFIVKLFKLIPRSTAAVIDSSIENDIILGAEHPFGVVIIPPDSYFTRDGEEYNGNVKVSTNVINPRNITDILLSPGVLAIRDEEGLDQQLSTRGMFSLFFETDEAPPRQIQLGKKVQVALDSSLVPTTILMSNQSANMLWNFNINDGKWQGAGELSDGTSLYKKLKKKKSFEAITFDNIWVGDMEIDVDNTWINFDYLGDVNDWCYSKIRVFTNNNFTQELEEEVDIFIISMLGDVVQGLSTSEDMSASSSGITGDIDGYCVFHMCNNKGNEDGRFEGYIIAEDINFDLDNPRLHPAEFNIGMTDEVKNMLSYVPIVHSENAAIFAEFSLDELDEAKETGPFHDWDDSVRESDVCINAPSTQNHFRLFQEKLAACDNPYTPAYKYLSCPEPGTQPPPDVNYLAWFPETNQTPPKYRVCFIKVKVINGMGEEISARSEMGTYRNPPNGISYYGERAKCLSSQEDSVCLEFKPGGEITNCVYQEDDLTLVTIKHTQLESDKTCTISEINPNTLYVYAKDIVDSGPDLDTFQMYMQDENYGERFGIYCKTADNEQTALNLAATCCSKGDDGNDSVIVPRTVNNENWALNMTCS